MLFNENNKQLYFNIIGYEFPLLKSTKEEYNYDANWLNCEFKYTEGDFNKTCIDSCLTTSELTELVDNFSKILNNAEKNYVSAFLEPYLEIEINRVENKIQFSISFAYESTNDDWKFWKISSLFELEDAFMILNNLNELQNLYPER